MDRLRGLDALRGMAAALVLAQHILVVLSRDLRWAGAILTAVDLGKFGVAIFFLISGFVIPFSLRRGLLAFGIGRAARLIPALWLSILFCLALGAQLEGWAQLLANAFMVTDFFRVPYISNPYWTLSWEMYFYAITAIAFALGWLRSPRTFGILALAFACASIYRPALTFMIFMFIGSLLRMVLVEKNEQARPWLVLAVASLAAAWFLWWTLASHRYPEVLVGLALALPAFLILWNRFDHPALLWLGAVSYSLYLFHLPILTALEAANLPAPLFAALGVLLPLLMAGAVYRWVERPMIAYGKTLSTGLTQRGMQKLPTEAAVGPH